jgi:hypothetical protein
MNLSFLSATAVLASVSLSSVMGAVITGNVVQNGNSNYAPDGVATQTNTGYGGVASRANDGINTGGFSNNSTTHTDDAIGGNNNWQVDLLASKPIDQIRLSNRGETLNNRLSNFRLQVLTSTNAEVWGQDFYTAGGFAGDSELVTLPAGISGQIVRVQQLGSNVGGNNVLSLAEVEVIDNKAATYTNYGLASAGAVASQSSVAYGGDPSRANDGNTDGNFGNGSVTHTDDAVLPATPVWFKLDLAEDIQINEIALWNRVECCWGRLGNIKVSILNNGSEVWSQSYLNSSPFVAKGIISIHDDLGGFFATGDQVKIELIGGVDGSGANNLSLAEVQVFGATVTIPEPTGLGVLGLAAGCVLTGRRRRR